MNNKDINEKPYDDDDTGKNENEQGQDKIFGREIFDWAEALVMALVVVVIIFALFVRMVGVDGESMYPTLHDRDQVFISHLFYDEPKQGDIVVLTKTSFIDRPIVKRVIAVSGQTVDIDFKNHKVIVNGKVLDEPYINEPTALEGDMVFPQTVPEGSVFVMGDNRNRSSDSRVSSLGMVDRRYILGRVLIRVFPFNRFGLIG